MLAYHRKALDTHVCPGGVIEILLNSAGNQTSEGRGFEKLAFSLDLMLQEL